jgi:hypothetical protein
LEPIEPKVPTTESAWAQGEEQATATQEVRPAQVVRSKVIVQVDDDEDAFPFMLFASSVSNIANAMNALAKEKAAPSTINSDQPIGTSSFIRILKEVVAKRAMMPKTMAYSGDGGAIDGFFPHVFRWLRVPKKP